MPRVKIEIELEGDETAEYLERLPQLFPSASPAIAAQHREAQREQPSYVGNPTEDPLYEQVRLVTCALETHGEYPTRDDIAEALRAAGYSIGSARLGNLLRTIRRPNQEATG
jgi:ribosomal protein L12E/L44/L45/RPP1/RPP2